MHMYCTVRAGRGGGGRRQLCTSFSNLSTLSFKYRFSSSNFVFISCFWGLERVGRHGMFMWEVATDNSGL